MDVEKVLESDWPVGMPLAPGLMKKREAEVVTKLWLIIAECTGCTSCLQAETADETGIQ